MSAGTIRLRRGIAPRLLGVDIAGALHLVGTLVKYLSAAFVFPTAIALGYGEPWWPFLAALGITFASGWGLERIGRNSRVGSREGFLVVALTWAFAAFFVSIPYLFAEPQLRNPLDAYFESMSGMTTTGASVLTDIEALDHSVAIWRQFSQWLGGMGIVVLALAVLPRLRVGGRQLLESEMPGPEYEPLSTSIRDTARRLWLVYVGLTALMILVLSIFGWTGVDREMSPFEAAAHAFTTMPTGGFSTRADSLASFSAASQWVVTLFMLLAGASFALHYRTLRRRANPAKDEELRLYLGLVLVGTLILFLELVQAGIFGPGGVALRHAALQVVSIMTTTGYASADFAKWTGLTSMTLVGLMLVGGCAGSTAGAIKVVRVLLLGRLLRRELDQTTHPEAVVPIRLNGRVVDERTLRAIMSFGLFYLLLFLLGSIALVIESARAGVAITPFDAVSAAATTLGNVGPGLGFLGPYGSFDPFSGPAKVVMILLMWMGRLEIIPVILLFTGRYWRR